MNKDTKTLTTKELERRGKEAREINERIEKQYNEAQKNIEKQVIEKKKKSKTQMMKELQKELKTEGIKSNLSTHSLIYQVRKPSEENPIPIFDFTNGELILKDCIEERKKLDKLLDELLQENEEQMTRLFDLVGATDEEREQYLAELESESELSKDLYFDLFGKDLEGDYRFEGTPVE